MKKPVKAKATPKRIDYNKTLEQLDGLPTPAIEADTHLVMTTNELRRKPMKDFTVEDLRLLAGQSFYLDIIIPMAIKCLQEDILSEGDHYPGDLLKNVLDSDSDYWLDQRDAWQTVVDLYEQNRSLFEGDNQYRQIRKSYDRFSGIHKRG